MCLNELYLELLLYTGIFTYLEQMIMKNVFYIFFMALAAGLCGCTLESDEKPSIELAYSQKENVEMSPDGDEKTVFFTSDHDWYTEVSGGDGWLDVTPAEGSEGRGRIQLSAVANLEEDDRTAQLRICCSKDAYVTITIGQKAFVPTFELEKDSRSISSVGGTVEVNLFTDTDYSYEINADWIKGMESKAVMKHMHFFTVEPNPYPEERTGVIEFISDRKQLKYTVIQRAAGTEGDDWIYEDFVDRSLAMRFTADWCGYCPYMATAFEAARINLGGRLEVVSLHGSGGLEFGEASKLMSRFKVAGFPTGIVDSRASIPNYEMTSVTTETLTDVVKETTENFPACTGIALKSSVKDGQISAEVSLYVKDADYYRVTVLLLEDDIIGYQYGVSSPNRYEHDHVARLALSNVRGDVVNIDKDGTVWTEEYSCKIPEYCDPDNLRLLVYVEKPFGDRTNVTGVSNAEYYDYGETYVDNCRSFKVGTVVELD